MNLLKSLLLSICLINSSLIQGEEVKLNEEEIKVLKKLELPPDLTNDSSREKFKQDLNEKLNEEKEKISREGQEKLQNLVDQKIKPKIDNIKNQIDIEKESLKKDIKKIVTGYMVSTVSLLAATLIAPQALNYCGAKPSVVIYAGSAIIYILNEIQIIQLLKASLLGEIEVVNGIEIDKNKSLKENAKLLEEKVDQQIGYIKAYKNTLDHAIKALKKKGQNAKMVSAGFLASSAVAAAEQMDLISGGGACVESGNLPKKSVEFSKDIDARYEKLISQSTKMEDKWSYYYEWESLKLGKSKPFNQFEYEKFKNIKVGDSIFIHAMKIFDQTIMNSVMAADNSSKKELSADLKKNKAVDWISDLDKMGIVGGVALNIVSFMTGWQIGFLESIIINGTSRSLTFGAQAALAFTAGSLFEQGANELEIKLTKVDKIIDEIQALAKKGINAIVPSDVDAQNLKDFASKLGVPSNKLITDMSLTEAENFLNEIKKKGSELGDEGKELLKRFEEDIKNKAKKIENESSEKINEVVPKSSWLKTLKNLFLSSAQAQEIRIQKTNNNQKELKKKAPVYLIQTMELHKKHQYFSKTKNETGIANSERIILENRTKLETFRNQLFDNLIKAGNKKQSKYSDYENAKIKEEIKKFNLFFQTLAPDQKTTFEEAMNPLNIQSSKIRNLPSIGNTPEKKSKLSWNEVKIMEKLLSKLNNQTPEKSNALESLDRSFKITDSNEKEQSNLDFGDISIHSKEVDLFEVIHHRYQQVWSRILKD